MKHASCRDLYRYWNQLRGKRPAPRRTEIEPADIRQVLSDTFILEVSGSRSARFRLAGTRLCGVYGREVKGVEFLDFFAPADREQIAAVLSAVTSDGAGAVMGITGEAARDRRAAFELLLLPLVQEGPGYDRILGAMSPMELPYWLGLDPVLRQTVSSSRLIWPDDDDPLAPLPPIQPVIASVVTATPAQRRGRFIVLDGGKSAR